MGSTISTTDHLIHLRANMGGLRDADQVGAKCQLGNVRFKFNLRDLDFGVEIRVLLVGGQADVVVHERDVSGTAVHGINSFSCRGGQCQIQNSG